MSSIAHYEGKQIFINRPPMVIFSAFSDLNLLKSHFPASEGTTVEATEDSAKITVNNISFGFKVKERMPYSLVSFENDESTPLPFTLSFCLVPQESDGTMFHIELDAELNGILKAMVGHRLQDAVDKLTESIQKGVDGANAYVASVSSSSNDTQDSLKS